MTRLRSTAVDVNGDQIAIDAEVLAPGLGFTVEALKENMAKGRVVSVAEKGVGEDAGRTRLTFRYRARIWRVVVEADGRLIEDPVPVAKPRAKAGQFSLIDLVKDAP